LNDVYWYDGCGQREEKAEECGNDGCFEGECLVCESEAQANCFNNDVYWYDSCGNRDNKKEECGSDGCFEGECLVCESGADNQCFNGDLWSYNSCGQREEQIQDCELGCEEGECVSLCMGFEICNGVDDTCDEVVDEECVEALTLVEPLEDEFDTRRIEFEFDVAQDTGKVEYRIDDDRYRTFCGRVGDCDRRISLRDGEHVVDFRIVDPQGVEHIIDKELFIDSSRPRITRQEPRNRGYAKGEFYVKYNEDNPEDVSLFIDSGEGFDLVAVSNDCPGGRNAECFIEVDLSEYEGQEIEYYMSVSDMFNTVDKSPYSVTVDTLAPEIEIVDVEKTSDLREQYRFTLELDERARVTYTYIDHRDRERTRTVCSRCDSASKILRFTERPDDITFRAVDGAGNAVELVFDDFPV